MCVCVSATCLPACLPSLHTLIPVNPFPVPKVRCACKSVGWMGGRVAACRQALMGGLSTFLPPYSATDGAR
ncbi:hypothetical protein F4809DRAFT_632208 [Biscogniauxia mediterranea]|nr:hypothetical protein F4809DRAFT_632208 [Biscogniauxia mediterranea]